MAKKRPREKRDVNVQLVEIFEDLASENETVRMKATKLLLARDNLSHEDVLSIFRRLVRGLCSGRKAARPGFSVALTEFLVQYASGQSSNPDSQSLDHGEILKVIRDQTRLSGDVTGQETRDHYLGKLFAAKAAIESKVFFQSKATDTWSQILDLIFEVAQDKLWLREECGWVLVETLRTLQGVSGDVYAQLVIDRLHSAGFWRSLEGVALWVIAREKFSTLKMPDDIFRHNDPLCRSEKPMLTKILKQTDASDRSEDEEKKAMKTGIWTSKLHFAWEVIFASCLKEAKGRVSFSDLWNEVVDEGIFAPSSSEERKHRGFLLVQRYMTNIPADNIPVVLGKNFVRCLVNQYAQGKRYLHTIAERTVKAIHNRATSDGQAASVILQTLIVSRGYANFDNQTKSKTIDKVLRELPLEYAEDVIQGFGANIVQPGIDDVKLASSKRRVLADYLLLIVRSLASPSSGDTRELHRHTMENALDVLVQAAYFDHDHATESQKVIQPLPRFAEQDRQIFRSRILSCLSHLISTDSEPAYHPYKIVQTLRTRITGGSSSGLKADEEVQQILQQSLKSLSKLHAKAISKKDGGSVAAYSALELLFSLNIIQACSGEADAAKMLEELQECYKSLLKDKSAQGNGSETVALVEIILTLVSKPSRLFKSIAQEVFSTFALSISEEGLECMFQTKESTGGLQELFEENGEGNEVDMDDASDVEEIVSSDSSGESDSENVDSGGDPGPEEDAEMAEFDRKLADALETRRADADAAIAGNESSDESMDDEQMAALDPVMANIFKERNKETSKKKEQKDAKENIVQFKSRVLELLQTYIKQQPLNPLTLSTVHPLLSLIKSTSSKQVSEKACDLVREFMKLYKLKVDGSRDKKAYKRARKILPGVHDLVVEGGSKAFVSACSQASLLLVKVVLNNGGTMDEASKQYSRTFERMADLQCKFQISLLQDFDNWLTSAKPVLLGAAK